MPSSFFAVQGLTKRFGGLTAVNEVSFELKRDQLVGLIGPQGAGKTTLLRLVTKILRPDKGSILFNGEDITRRRAPDTRPFHRLVGANGAGPQSAPAIGVFRPLAPLARETPAACPAESA